VSELFSSGKKLKIDLGELEDQKDLLFAFLKQIPNLKVTSENHRLLIDSVTSPEVVEKRVQKFIYQRHLNNTYWAALESGAVKIHKFKQKKDDGKKKRTTPPSMIKHGW
jgi:hypothetical protein